MPEEKKEDETKKKAEEEAPVSLPVDARVMWFEEKVCNALKIKADKFKKLITVGENVYLCII
jgi:hypothetical protein